MRLNTKDLNPGTRFDVPNDEDGAWVSLRVLDSEAGRKIRKHTTKIVRKLLPYRDEGKKRAVPQLAEWEEVDNEAFTEMMWDYCIVDFGGWFNEEDEEIPCTKENKAMLMGESVLFAGFVADSLDQLGKAEETFTAEKQEEEEKNLESSQSGFLNDRKTSLVSSAVEDTD